MNEKPSNDHGSSTDSKRISKPPESSATSEPLSTPKVKPEDKPFQEFINEEFIPSLLEALNKYQIHPITLNLMEGERPVVGGSCWMVFGEIPQGRRFWLCFSSDSIASSKTIAIAETDTEASLLESFLIDEKKTTLKLLLSRLLQRLNGQKWLGAN